eukprot:GGOE01045377.1.p1 GENE.GGOE01045377.1~~GGOE01045377.1.p1  ORF type:complete len:469 (+),score=134.59 GGOE01045377.1:195-1409(+)
MPDVPSMRRALLQAFEGVAHLHRLGIIHSDLKPSNLLVAANGTVRVGDLDVSVELATRLSSQYANTVLGAVGFTAGFAAPELLCTGATKASDVYSLGAVVREMGRLADVGPQADTFIAHLCAKESESRPTVARAMQDDFFGPARAWQRGERRTCCVMGSEKCAGDAPSIPLEDGVECTGGAGEVVHFVCNRCLEEYAQTFLGNDLRLLRACEGRLRCPQCPGRATPYPDQQLAQHLPTDLFGAYLALRQRLTEQQLAEQFDQQLQAALEAERAHLRWLDNKQQQVRQARQYVTESILNLHCPRCQQVFVDYDGCCALSCTRCPCHFCGWCGRDCGCDAHRHVANCSERPSGCDGLFPGAGVWADFQLRRGQSLVEKYLRTLDAETRRAVETEMRPILVNLGIVS